MYEYMNTFLYVKVFTSFLLFDNRAFFHYPLIKGGMNVANESEIETEGRTGFHTISPEESETLRDNMPDPEQIEALGNLNKILKDTTRLRILLYISQQELCVHDLTELLDMNQPAVSHQLATLQQHELLERRKEGRVVYYSLQDDVSMKLIQTGLNAIR